MLRYYDTETIGFHGPIVLYQWAIDNGPINLYCPWEHEPADTLALFEEHLNDHVVGFNLAFDHFHIQQMVCVLLELVKHNAGMDDYARFEKAAVFGPCCKQRAMTDVMLQARRTIYQRSMEHKPVWVRRVPTVVAHALNLGRVVEKGELSDICIKSERKGGLKDLAVECLGSDVVRFGDIPLPGKPDEYGYRPYTTGALGEWPSYLQRYIDMWCYNRLARQYASDDVKYTRLLAHYMAYFIQDPDPNAARDYALSGKWTIPLDLDPLAGMVASVRWRGFRIEEMPKANLCPIPDVNINSSKSVKAYLTQVMSPTEASVLKDTSKNTLRTLAKWEQSEVCDCVYGCDKCKGTLLISTGVPHPVAERAQAVMNARIAAKEQELYDKLSFAGRFHVSKKVIGALSGRMSGADGLNAEGIKRDKSIRRRFPLADPGEVLYGGDFDSFQVTIADAVYHDPELHSLLLQGKKIHALFGMELFGKTYDEIVADLSLYSYSKNGVFALLFGGNEQTLARRCNVDEERAREGYAAWVRRFPVWGACRQAVINRHTYVKLEGRRMTRLDGALECDSMYGWKRYYHDEVELLNKLLDLKPVCPEGMIIRRDRPQSYQGATMSALIGAAMRIQARIVSTACNHEIQAPEASIVKRILTDVWDLQPVGIHNWVVRPFSVHDELQIVTTDPVIPAIQAKIDNVLDDVRKRIPLVGLRMKKLTSWGEK